MFSFNTHWLNLKIKKGKTVLDAFMKILNKSNNEPKTS